MVCCAIFSSDHKWYRAVVKEITPAKRVQFMSVTHIHVYIQCIYIVYMYMYVCICTCTCACMCIHVVITDSHRSLGVLK